jgi:hypothetical protein
MLPQRAANCIARCDAKKVRRRLLMSWIISINRIRNLGGPGPLCNASMPVQPSINTEAMPNDASCMQWYEEERSSKLQVCYWKHGCHQPQMAADAVPEARFRETAQLSRPFSSPNDR